MEPSAVIRNVTEERKAAVIGCFARYFGDRARGARAFAEPGWGADVFSRGGYAGIAPPGFLTDHGPALREPVGLIYWAGTEKTTAWTGYVDGAVESGERAAWEVLASGSAAYTGSPGSGRKTYHAAADLTAGRASSNTGG